MNKSARTLGVLQVEELLIERFDTKYLHQVSYLRDAYGVGVLQDVVGVCSYILLSIWYNVCACHSPVYHYITATAVYLIQRIITACVVVMRSQRLYLSRMNSQCGHYVCCKSTSTR